MVAVLPSHGRWTWRCAWRGLAQRVSLVAMARVRLLLLLLLGTWRKLLAVLPSRCGRPMSWQQLQLGRLAVPLMLRVGMLQILCGRRPNQPAGWLEAKFRKEWRGR